MEVARNTIPNPKIKTNLKTTVSSESKFEKENHEENYLCDKCSEEKSKYYCQACKETFCEECLDFFHRKEDKKNHIKEKLTKVNNINIKCEKHQSKNIRYLCMDCNKFVCTNCLIHSAEHKSHPLKEVNNETIEHMINITLKHLRERISNERKTMLSQIDKIYETRKIIVSPLNFYVQNMVQTNQLDQLNIPLSYQLTLLKPEFKTKPEFTYQELEEELLIKTPEILQAREDLIPLFSTEDEFHKQQSLDYSFQWASLIHFLEPAKSLLKGDSTTIRTMKPTKYLMEKSKLDQSVMHFQRTELNSRFTLIFQFDSATEYSAIEFYENHNAGAVESIEADFSNSQNMFNCRFEPVWTGNFCLNLAKSRTLLAQKKPDQIGRTKFVKVNFNLDRYAHDKYQFSGVCLVTKKQQHKMQMNPILNSLFHDIKVHIKDGNETATFKSHKIILCKSETISKVLLEHPKIENITIHCSLDVFKKFFYFLYTGKLNYDKSEKKDILQFATEYEIKGVNFAGDGFFFKESDLYFK
eukprot:gene7697-12163_t